MSELFVPPELRRNRRRDPVAIVDAAVWLIDHMAGHLGRADLGELDVLDFGCGVRFTQAFVDRGVPIGHYVGVDAARDVVDFLRANVSDPRLEHYHLDAHNDLYNPNGQPLGELTVPEIEGRTFDLICLFSVFTHLAPDDYVAMLRLLRRFAKPDTRLFYTVFINEPTEGGFGYVDRVSAAVAKAMENADGPKLRAAIEAGTGSAGANSSPVEPEPFVDADPQMPLRVALYSRRHALELIEGTGWNVLEVAPPDVHLQHHIVAVPDSV